MDKCQRACVREGGADPSYNGYIYLRGVMICVGVLLAEKFIMIKNYDKFTIIKDHMYRT